MSAAETHARREELRSGLAAVRERIDAARRAAGRDDEVRLIAVTKTFPASDVELLAELGQLDVGENRDQEAMAKRALVGIPGVRWHMIGQVQRNKARSVSGWADLVHSVDRAALAEALDQGARGHDRVLDVLIQVSLDPQDGEGERGGAAPGEVRALAGRIARLPGLRLRGVMGVAPIGGADRAFEALHRASQELRREHPDAVEISAGMSTDLEEAIGHGATQVRIGAAILGNRGRLQ